MVALTSDTVSQVVLSCLEGCLLFETDTQARLNLQGEFPRIPGGRLKMTGSADVEAGSFAVETILEAAHVAGSESSDSLGGIDFISGRLKGAIAFVGEEKLSIAGTVKTQDAAFNIGPAIQVSDCNLSGELVGFRLDIRGDLSLNGISLPLKGQVADLRRLNWRILVDKKDIDVTSMRWDALDAPPLAGRVDLRADFHSRPHSAEPSWEGEVRFDSEVLSLLTSTRQTGAPVAASSTLDFKDIHLRGRLTPKAARIDTLYAQVFGGDLTLEGSLELGKSEPSAPRTMEVSYARRWRKGELGDWISVEQPCLSVRGSLSRQDQDWIFHGAATLKDEYERALLNGSIALEDNHLLAKAYPSNRQGTVELEVDLNKNGSGWIHLIGDDVMEVLSPIVSGDYLPAELTSYKIDADISGDLENYRGWLRWRSSALSRGGVFRGSFARNEVGMMSVKGSLDLEFPQAQGVSGEIAVNLRKNRFDFRECTLKNRQGQQVLWVNGRLMKTPAKAAAGDRKGLFGLGSLYAPDSLDIVLDHFPLFDLLHSVKPTWARDVSGDFSAAITAHGDSIRFAAYSDFKHPAFTDYSLALVGLLRKGGLQFDKAAMVKLSAEPNEPPQQVLGLTGRLDFSTSRLDSMELSIDRLSLGDLAEALNLDGSADDSSAKMDGFINGRFLAWGDLRSPDLTVDAHLTSGIIQGERGFWSNLQIDTHDSLYRLNHFDFGKGVGALFKAQGAYNRTNGDYSLLLHSDSIEIDDALRTAAVKSRILTGRSWLRLSAQRREGCQAMEGALEIKAGGLGGLSFDQILSRFKVTGLDEGNPAVSIDTVSIDWGDSKGNIEGVIPLTQAAPLSLRGRIEGCLLGWLTRLEPKLKYPKGNGFIEFELDGTTKRPHLRRGLLDLDNGSLTVNEVISELKNVNIHIEADSSGRVSIDKFESRIEGKPLQISNRFPGDDEEIPTIQMGGFDWGVIQLQTGEEGVWLVVPSLMKPDWGGFFVFTGKEETGPFELFGPGEQPLAVGRVIARNATFTYPFLKGSGKPPSPFGKAVLGLLERMRWDAAVVPERGCRYINEISSLGDVPFLKDLHKRISSPLFNLDLKIYVDLSLDEEREGLHFTGSLADTFHVDGGIASSRGTIDFLDMEFKAKDLQIRFTPAELDPVLSGSAVTTITDSIGMLHEVRMTLRRNPALQRFSTAGEEGGGGRWNELSMNFEDDEGHSQEQILAMMGYAPDQMTSKLTGLGGALVEEAMPIRRWTRVLERSMQRWLGVDRVEIDPQVTRNLIERQLYPGDTLMVQEQYNAYLKALDQSSVTIGKYLTRDVYVSYTGLLQHGADTYNMTRLGMVHAWDVMIWLPEVSPSLNLNYRYSYDSLVELGDNSIRVRYSFFLDKKRFTEPSR